MERVISQKRVVLVYWKKNIYKPFEVFSNLKNFCLSYPAFNYNTINNYLSKRKVHYENEEARIERKIIFNRPQKHLQTSPGRLIEPVVRKVPMKDGADAANDLAFWQTQPVFKRLAAVTSIISQSLKNGERMDKTFVRQKMMRS